MTPSPHILALDFDGVICDGLIEYFQTAWKAYCHLFKVTAVPPTGLAEDFYKLRPVVETGWEMPILIHALRSGISAETIFQTWPTLAPQLTAEAGLDKKAVVAVVDGVRDAWIGADLENWLSQHRFYPGVMQRLRQVIKDGIYPIIISTKEGRFIERLLSQQGIQLGAGQILGKEIKQPKYVTLRQLQAHPPIEVTSPVIWFVEDRLQALELVEEQPDLGNIALFLADWGYNTAAEQAKAEQSARIHRLSLNQFAAPFTQW